MFNKTKLAVAVAITLGAASGALADGYGLHNNEASNMRSDAHAVGGPRARRQLTPSAYGANTYRVAPAPSRLPDAPWHRMDCDTC
jgi:hypothetical protein